MRIAQKYSHLNGEEYLLVHHKNLYHELEAVIKSVDAHKLKNKKSEEKTMRGRMLFSPIELNKAFNQRFRQKHWLESRYQYYVTTDPRLMQELIVRPFESQKEFLIKNGVKRSYFVV
jgi:hypothetical protein